MKKVMFVCHGNICRSPMAEFVFRDMVKKAGRSDEFIIKSAATSTEEIGNSVHYGTRSKLSQLGISCAGKTAVQLKKSDYEEYDYIIGMDSANIRNIIRITNGDLEKKVFKLMEFAESSDDVADPWYTGDFEKTYEDIKKGLDAFLEFLDKE